MIVFAVPLASATVSCEASRRSATAHSVPRDHIDHAVAQILAIVASASLLASA
jgi:hypothetical protein